APRRAQGRQAPAWHDARGVPRGAAVPAHGPPGRLLVLPWPRRSAPGDLLGCLPAGGQSAEPAGSRAGLHRDRLRLRSRECRGRSPLRPLQVAAMLATSLLLAGLVLLPLAPLAAVAEATLVFAAIAVTNVAGTTLLANETRAGYATTMTFNQSLNGAGWAVGSSLGGLLIALGGYHALGVGILLTGTPGAILAWQSAPREAARTVRAGPP